MSITPQRTSVAGQGLYLLRAIIDAGARSEFRQVDARLFLESELPAYRFVRSFYQQHGTFPTPALVHSPVAVTHSPAEIIAA